MLLQHPQVRHHHPPVDGDTITFAAMTADSCCQASSNFISAFDAPTSDVPEPSTIAILAVGLAGLGMSRRKWLR